MLRYHSYNTLARLGSVMPFNKKKNKKTRDLLPPLEVRRRKQLN